MPINTSESTAAATAKSDCGASRVRNAAAIAIAAYATTGNTPCQSQSSSTGVYCVCRRARCTVITAYASPAAPQEPTAMPTFASLCHGALSAADTISAAQKWTILGVPNAASVRLDLGALTVSSAISATTTNIRPASAAADEPTLR